MKEVWLTIAGYEGCYEVSNLGAVRSLDRPIKDGKTFVKGKIMKPLIDKKGYLNVNLSRRGKIFHAKVHRLVAQAFIENKNEHPEVNHLNFIKSDNKVENLEWVTGKENAEHFFSSVFSEERNSKLRKENNPNSKLSQFEVDLIKKMRNEYKMKLNVLSLLFCVSLSQIKRIVYGQQWVKEVI